MSNKHNFSDKSYSQIYNEIKNISFVFNGGEKFRIEDRYCVDLVLLYTENSGLEKTKHNLFNIFEDSDGIKYLRLTSRGSEFVDSYNMFKRHKKKDNNLSKKNIRSYIENAQDEMIDDLDKSIKRSNKERENLQTIVNKQLEATNDFTKQKIMFKGSDFYKIADLDSFREFYISKQ